MQLKQSLSICGMLGLWILLVSAPGVCLAQEETSDEERYRQDYEKVQKIAAVSDPRARADQLLAFIKERPDPKLVEYAQSNYLHVLDGYLKAEKYDLLLTLSERYVQARPKVPEPYYFYGSALRHKGRYKEAIEALARCSVVRNPLSSKARQFLEFLYKGQNKGSLTGLGDIIRKAEAQMND